VAVSRRARSTRLLVVSLVMASLVTITIDFKGGSTGPLELAGKTALSIVGPLQDAVSHLFRPIGSFFSGLAHVGSLESDNHRLQDEITRLRQAAGTRVSTERELERLQRLLDLQQNLGLTGVTATVIGASPSNFEWSITINRGSSDGVKPNLPVVAGEGLVGLVTEVSLHWSTVQLIIDPRSAVAGRLASSGETGLVTGQRGNPMIMDLVNPNVKVAPNELVVTSGYQGGLYPPEIPIGYVSSSYARPGSLTKSILVRPAVDFSSLEVVEVVLKAHPKPAATTKPRTGGTASPQATPSAG
jgi:rod shape-determining protein MreC